MAKLTKQQQRTLAAILDGMQRTQAYIMKPNHHIVVESSITTFPDSAWTNGNGKKGVAITKDIGSDLVCLYRAIHDLEHLLQEVK